MVRLALLAWAEPQDLAIKPAAAVGDIPAEVRRTPEMPDVNPCHSWAEKERGMA